MKLYDLKHILKMCADFADDEVDATVYFELDDIPDKIARKIEVVAISENFVTCKFTDYLRRNKSKLAKYIEASCHEYPRLEAMYRSALIKAEDILEDGGEAVYSFINEELEYFLQY